MNIRPVLEARGLKIYFPNGGESLTTKSELERKLSYQIANMTEALAALGASQELILRSEQVVRQSAEALLPGCVAVLFEKKDGSIMRARGAWVQFNDGKKKR